jgi:hypothetical protein
LGSLFTIETPEDSVADYVAACRARGRKTVQGVAVIFATMVA